MFSFVYHESLLKEIKQFERKQPKFAKARIRLEKLLCIHFNPVTPTVVIGPKVLLRIQKNDDYEMWKVICATEGLKKKQSPRLYFALQELTFFMLCMGSHITNYDDRVLRDLAFSRVHDLVL
jgi:hypothetical protein